MKNKMGVYADFVLFELATNFVWSHSRPIMTVIKTEENQALAPLRVCCYKKSISTIYLYLLVFTN